MAETVVDKTPLQEAVGEGGAAAGATPANTAAATPANETPAVDQLDADIAANDAAIKAEEDARRQAAPATGATPAPTPATPVGAPAAKPVAAPAGFVPVAVMLRVRDEANRWRDQALVNHGKAQAATEIAQAGGTGAQPAAAAEPQKTPEEQIAEKRAAKKANGDLFDSGKITAAELTVRNDAIEDEIFVIREGQRAPAQAAGFDTTVEQHAVTLVEKNPVLNHLDATQVRNLTADAYELAELSGKPFGKGALETMRLRDAVAQLATEKYAKFYVKGGAAPAAGTTALPQAGATGSQPAAGGVTAADRAKKVDLQNRMPPDTSAVGSPDAGVVAGDAETMAGLAGLSEDEQIRRLDAMPGVVQRLTGLTKL